MTIFGNKPEPFLQYLFNACDGDKVSKTVGIIENGVSQIVIGASLPGVLFADSTLGITNPSGVAVHPDGRVFVSNLNSSDGRHFFGQILVMQDSDGDGIADRSTIFADSLTTVTGVDPAPINESTHRVRGRRNRQLLHRNSTSDHSVILSGQPAQDFPDAQRGAPDPALHEQDRLMAAGVDGRARVLDHGRLGAPVGCIEGLGPVWSSPTARPHGPGGQSVFPVLRTSASSILRHVSRVEEHVPGTLALPVDPHPNR